MSKRGPCRAYSPDSDRISRQTPQAEVPAGAVAPRAAGRRKSSYLRAFRRFRGHLRGAHPGAAIRVDLRAARRTERSCKPAWAVLRCHRTSAIGCTFFDEQHRGPPPPAPREGGCLVAGNPEKRTALRMVNIEKYFGPVRALKDINLQVGRNEIVGLIGDNGAGKSTMVKILTGVSPPNLGRAVRRRPESGTWASTTSRRRTLRDRDGVPGQIAGRKAGAVAELLHRPHQIYPIWVHRRARRKRRSPARSC